MRTKSEKARLTFKQSTRNEIWDQTKVCDTEGYD